MKYLDSIFGNLPSDLNNPFTLDGIDSISIYIRKATLFDKGFVRGEWMTEAFIRFKNNNTSGKQELTAHSLSELCNKIQSFCSHLKQQ